MKFFRLILNIILVFLIRANSYPSDCILPFPRSYVVYHLNEQEAIYVDGKLNDEAWKIVSWTEDFIGNSAELGAGVWVGGSFSSSSKRVSPKHVFARGFAQEGGGGGGLLKF